MFVKSFEIDHGDCIGYRRISLPDVSVTITLNAVAAENFQEYLDSHPHRVSALKWDNLKQAIEGTWERCIPDGSRRGDG